MENVSPDPNIFRRGLFLFLCVFLLNILVALLRFDGWPFLNYVMFGRKLDLKKYSVIRPGYIDDSGQLQLFKLTHSGTLWTRQKYSWEMKGLLPHSNPTHHGLESDRLKRMALEDCTVQGYNNCDAKNLVLVKRFFIEREDRYQTKEQIVFEWKK